MVSYAVYKNIIPQLCLLFRPPTVAIFPDLVLISSDFDDDVVHCVGVCACAFCTSSTPPSGRGFLHNKLRCPQGKICTRYPQIKSLCIASLRTTFSSLFPSPFTNIQIKNLVLSSCSRLPPAKDEAAGISVAVSPHGCCSRCCWVALLCLKRSREREIYLK